MIAYGKRRLKKWRDMKWEWRRLIDTKGFHQINRVAPVGYGQAPDVLIDKVEGPGFVVYPDGWREYEPNHYTSSGSPIYGNSYCGTLNPF